MRDMQELLRGRSGHERRGLGVPNRRLGHASSWRPDCLTVLRFDGQARLRAMQVASSGAACGQSWGCTVTVTGVAATCHRKLPQQSATATCRDRQRPLPSVASCCRTRASGRHQDTLGSGRTAGWSGWPGFPPLIQRCAAQVQPDNADKGPPCERRLDQGPAHRKGGMSAQCGRGCARHPEPRPQGANHAQPHHRLDERPVAALVLRAGGSGSWPATSPTPTPGYQARGNELSRR